MICLGEVNILTSPNTPDEGLCSKTVVHGGAAHAAVETNGGLQTDANYRPISVIPRARAIMIASEQQWNCMTLIGRRWVVKIININNNLMSESAATMAAPAAAVPTPMLYACLMDSVHCWSKS